MSADRDKREVDEPGPRRSHYRLGFDCSGSAATRYTLYSASMRFLWCYKETDVYVYVCSTFCEYIDLSNTCILIEFYLLSNS